MKLSNISEVNDFLKAVNNCKGDVWLVGLDGSKINLKSSLSQYVAVAELVTEKGNELELFCSELIDEHIFFELFDKHPEIIG